MERWLGGVHPAHVIEHYVALLQRRLDGRLLPERMEQFRAVCMAMLLVSYNGVLTRGVLVVIRALVQAASRALPYAVVSASLFYSVWVYVNEWLQDEWKHWLTQWRYKKLVCCPICCDDLPDTPWCVAELPCCGGRLCWACVRQHAEGVVDDGRPEMLCPLLPCKQVLPDVLVSAAVRRQRWSRPAQDLFGALAHRKWRSYERWVRVSGLAASCAARLEDVVHCPGDDCGYMWVLPRSSRRSKSDAEPQSRWNPRSWGLGRQLGLYSAPVSEGGLDRRHLGCPKCAREFCLLCSAPWRTPTGACHKEKTCVEFRGERPKSDEWGGARQCPGCPVRIVRSMGCNHMVCTQCKAEFCWMCGATWTSAHYGCRGRVAPECALM